LFTIKAQAKTVNKNMQNSPAAIQFIDTILEEKGMEGVDEDVRLQLRDDLLGRLDDQVNRSVINALPQEQLAKFEHLIDSDQLDQLQPFLEKNGVNMQAIVARVMADFRAMYLGE
jgi:hypothetical protein